MWQVSVREMLACGILYQIPKWASWAISCVCFGQIQKYVVIKCIFLVWADWQAKRSSADGLLLNHPDFTKRRPQLQTTALLNLSRVSGNVVYCQQNRGGLNPPPNSCFRRTRSFQSSVVEELKWNVTTGSCLCGGGMTAGSTINQGKSLLPVQRSPNDVITIFTCCCNTEGNNVEGEAKSQQKTPFI